TNALGKTHNEVRQDLLTSDARQAQRTLTSLCYMLSALNFGASDPRRCPRFEFDTRDPADLALYADAIPKFVGAGMKIGRQWAQDKLMIPEPKDGEDILTVPKPQMALPPEERVDELPRTAKMRYRAVLRNAAGEIVYPDQDELDQTIAALPADAITEALRATLGPAIAALRRGATPDEAIEMLLEAQPDMDDTAMQELLAHCIFVADVWGRLNGG
ncbi:MULTISPECIES: phage portal protein family protein, partial [unclassified Burkholderia]